MQIMHNDALEGKERNSTMSQRVCGVSDECLRRGRHQQARDGGAVRGNRGQTVEVLPRGDTECRLSQGRTCSGSRVHRR